MYANLIARVALAAMSVAHVCHAEAGNKTNTQAPAQVQRYMAGPSVFVQNAGQWKDASIAYALDGAGANVGLTERGPKFQLFHLKATPSQEQSKAERTGNGTTPAFSRAAPLAQKAHTPDPAISEMHPFSLLFDGAPPVMPVGRGRSARQFNYMLGDTANHRSNVPSFDTVWYENLYPGVSLELTGRRTGLKYNFHIAPGADWRAIRLRYDNIEHLSLGQGGALEIRVAEDWEPLLDGAPCIYQEVAGTKRPVSGRFVLIDDHTYGFELTGPYDTTLPLVIDPEVAWSTYLGGTGGDSGDSIAVDPRGNVYITGTTRSSGWVGGGWDVHYEPTTDPYYTDLGNAYVAKLDPNGAHVWSTYLGGNGTKGQAIAVDGNGNAYATGFTATPGWVSGGWNTSFDHSIPAYVVKLNATGSHVWSTYVPGEGCIENSSGIAVDPSGNAYVTGYTDVPGWVEGGWNTTYNGAGDAYVLKLSMLGAHLWSTYLGGPNREEGRNIAVDANGNAYATGCTESPGWVYGGGNANYGGGTQYYQENNFYLGDAYVVKLSAAGAHLWSTYLGGSNNDCGNAIAVDSSQEVYVTGGTNSPDWVSGGWDTTYNGGDADAYVAKLTGAGMLAWAAYVGGYKEDSGEGIGVDSRRNVWVTGSTNSAGWVGGGWRNDFQSGDAYVLKLSTTGEHLWSTYLGGGFIDTGEAVAVSANGTAWVTGTTNSSAWVSGGWKTSYAGNGDAYAAKIVDSGQTGSLQVELTPAEAVSDGAQWRRVTTTVWRNSGDIETGLPTGHYLLEFKDSLGWTTPDRRTVSIQRGETTRDTGAYAAVPESMSWSTYLGGSRDDRACGIAVDANGNAYVTGNTTSSGWVSGGWNTTYTGSSSMYANAYVVKLSPTGSHLWSTYFGDVYLDSTQAIAVDSSGNAYATGTANSPAWMTHSVNAYHGNGYAVKLSPTGSCLWTTWLGGDGYGIAVDKSENVYVTGRTRSDGWTVGGWDTSYDGGTVQGQGDGYVMKLNQEGVHAWSTYLGGADGDSGDGVAVDSDGYAYVTGTTTSPGWVSGGGNTDLGGACDGFLVKLSASGEHVWSTYLGGLDDDAGYGVAVDATGNAYVAGHTQPADGTVTTGPYGAFVAKLSALGTHLWSTYVSGMAYGIAYGIAADSSGNAYATGWTTSAGWAHNGWDTTYNGAASSTPLWHGYYHGDAYVVKLGTDGTHKWSTYLGGTNDDGGYGIALNSSGAIYVAGCTDSPSWISGGWNTNYGGNTDGFVLKLVELKPFAPSSPGSTEIGLDTITWTWQDNSSTETGFNVYEEPGAGSPCTQQTRTPAEAVSWKHNGLSANTEYAFQVSATNREGDSAKTPNYTAWTLIEPVSALRLTLSPYSIAVASDNLLTHIDSGLSGLFFENVTLGTTSMWLHHCGKFTSSGLTPDTPYSLRGRSRNGAGIETAPATRTVYTLAAIPVAPVVDNPTAHSLDVTIGFGDGNHSATSYAIQVSPAVDGNAWIRQDGSIGSVPFFQTASAWGTKTATGLYDGTNYALTVVARNGDGVLTTPGPAGNGATRDVTPPTAIITLDDPTPTGENTLHVRVDFSESVGTTFSEADVTLAGTLTGTLEIGGANPTYMVTVTLSAPDADGTLGIQLGAEVADLAGNPYAGGSSPLYTLRNWPSFTAQPKSARAYTGDSDTFAVAIANGTATYQWKWEDNAGVVHDGPGTPAWTLTRLSPANRGTYWCEVNYPGNGTTYPTRRATLDVQDHLALVIQPTGGDAYTDGPHTFTVEAEGGYAPYAYLWRKDGEAIPGATEASYTRANLAQSDSGTYTVEVSDDNTDVQIASTDLTVVQRIPVSASAGLGMLSGCLCACGLITLRRRAARCRRW